MEGNSRLKKQQPHKNSYARILVGCCVVLVFLICVQPVFRDERDLDSLASLMDPGLAGLVEHGIANGYNSNDSSQREGADSAVEHADTSSNTAEAAVVASRNVSTDPCSVEHWLAELEDEEQELLKDLTQEDIGMVHITYSVGGSKDRKANDMKNGTHNRDSETGYSVACLKKTMPTLQYQEVKLGDFASYQEALVAQHSWLAGESPFKGTFVIDTDVYANPESAVTPYIMARTLKNVDMSLVWNPEREAPNMYRAQPINLQLSGLQAGLIGQRNNKRTQLFNACVADVLRKTSFSIRQQRAVNQVLESPLAQFVRVRWLPPEYHCWSPSLEKLSDFVVDNGPSVQKDPCYFVHSHNIAKKGNLKGVC